MVARKALKIVARLTYSRSLQAVPNRLEIPEVLNRRGLLGKAVEVGVRTGLFSEHLLETWNGEHLTSVDPWLAVPTDEWVATDNVSQEAQESLYKEACTRLASFSGRSTVMRATSAEASKQFDKHSLDFVYIDARHDKASVEEDLALWFEKVRPGGIFAGDDYVDGVFQWGEFGVKSAVDEFFAGTTIPVRKTRMEAFPSWIVAVPSVRPALKTLV